MQERDLADLMSDVSLFVAVARAGSFTRASSATQVPIATVSRRVARLEAELGVRLLDRSTRRVTLTDAGRHCLGTCEELVADARAALEAVRDRASTVAGVLRVSMTPDFGQHCAAGLIARFAQDHPALEFRLDLTPRSIDLIADRFDLAIHMGPLRDSSYTVRRIATLRNALFASPRYLARAGVPAVPGDLAGHACIALPHQRGVLALSRGSERETVRATSRFQTNNLGMMKRLAMHDHGIVACGVTVARDEVASGALRRVLPDWELEPVIVSGVTASRVLTPKVRLFIDYMARELPRLDGSA